MASAAAGNFIAINSLRGGMNNTDKPHMLPDDQCVLAMNVEFFYSTLGERRLGCQQLDITGSGLDTETQVVHLSEWFPTNDAKVSDLWVITATPGASVKVAYRDISLAWHPVTPTDPILPTEPQIWEINAQPFNGVDFFAYYSTVDRLHLWDGNAFRRAGLVAPATAPTAVDEGSGSTYTTTRYFRVRTIRKLGGIILLRSEPSPVDTFVPSGSGAGALLTMPPSYPPDEGATDWEIEASLDNANFYRIATQPLFVTTYTDTVQDSQFYSDFGPLSEAVGSYLLPQSGKYLLVDGDRLVIVSHWSDPALKSRVWWTPPTQDPGVGNDERVPIVTTGGLPIVSFKDLDNYDGGGVTGVSRTANGSFYVFKWSAVYQFARTQDDTNAYNVIQLSSNAGPRGAIEGSIVPAVDEYGQACIYFLDPWIGPSRIGNMGMERIDNLRQTWKSVNTLANTVAARGVYYPDKQQVWWVVAFEGSNTPTLMIKLQISEIKDGGGIATRGFSLANGLIAQATAMTGLSELVLNDGQPQLSRRPIIGLPAPLFVMRTDTSDKDDVHEFHAEILSKPYLPVGIMNQWETMVGAIMADPGEPEAKVQIEAVRDFGLESSVAVATKKPIVVDFVPKGDETQVIRQLDDLHMAEAYAIQFRFADPDPGL